MPRKAPTQVIEQRVTLGDLERSLLKPYVDNLVTAQKIDTIQESFKTGAYVLVGGGTVFIGYSLYKWAQAFVDEWTGRPTWADPSYRIWSDENRANFRTAHPSLFSRALQGPSILWAMMWE
jgi:hypothetical protein|tara:strand:+ start:381 stop:743 length:363 start_codon:yes stop_codon:yes gene_type:complete